MHIGSKSIVGVQLGKLAPSDQVVVTAHTPDETRQVVRSAIELHSPVQHKLRDYILNNRNAVPCNVIPPNTHGGKSVAICGAGPSLANATIEGVDDIWACNSALPYLVDAGVRVTVGCGIDQTLGLLAEWTDAPDVPYYLASSVDPALVAHLQEMGRSITFFHSHVGCDENELDLYRRTWPSPTVMAGEGMSVTTRMIGVAQWMGYERIDIYGADCCFGPNDLAHANGDRATDAYHNPQIATGSINGRAFRTRPDMLMDAVSLARRVRDSRGTIRLMGDTLPVFLLGKPDDVLDQVCGRKPYLLPTG